jgi:hypothetical protein
MVVAGSRAEERVPGLREVHAAVTALAQRFISEEDGCTIGVATSFAQAEPADDRGTKGDRQRPLVVEIVLRAGTGQGRAAGG